jgi:hypothetical protein
MFPLSGSRAVAGTQYGYSHSTLQYHRRHIIPQPHPIASACALLPQNYQRSQNCGRDQTTPAGYDVAAGAAAACDDAACGRRHCGRFCGTRRARLLRAPKGPWQFCLAKTTDLEVLGLELEEGVCGLEFLRSAHTWAIISVRMQWGDLCSHGAINVQHTYLALPGMLPHSSSGTRSHAPQASESTLSSPMPTIMKSSSTASTSRSPASEAEPATDTRSHSSSPPCSLADAEPGPEPSKSVALLRGARWAPRVLTTPSIYMERLRDWRRLEAPASSLAGGCVLVSDDQFVTTSAVSELPKNNYLKFRQPRAERKEPPRRRVHTQDWREGSIAASVKPFPESSRDYSILSIQSCA